MKAPFTGTMQNWPLVLTRPLDHAERFHADREMITRSVEGPIHRTTYGELARRARRGANALRRLKIGFGDRVGTVAWNTYRHFEAWYSIFGLGAVYHTINPRLFPDQIAFIVNDAGDRLLMVDLTFVPLLESLAPRLKSVEGYIILTDEAHMPKTTLPNAMCYETLLANESDDFSWVPVDENAPAGLCYTSGTTGNPKGVVYTHRSNLLHALAINSADAFGVKNSDTVLTVVPMYHANAWALAFVGPMQGAKLLMPGAKLDAASLYELMVSEDATYAAGVPTIWMMMLDYMKTNELTLPKLRRAVIGGAAPPAAMIETLERTYGIDVCHAWGMTELSPVGTCGTLKAGQDQLSYPEQLALKTKQGRACFTVEMRVIDDNGKELPRDGVSAGLLQVRGPAVVDTYFGADAPSVCPQGWFSTGDIATIDPHGFLKLTDRAKDVIKSGGEWISSIEIENLAMGHPDIAEAAVIGVKHPRWDERPLLVAVARKGKTLDKDSVLTFLAGKIAKWWMPDDVIFVDELPHTATGKLNKLALRGKFGDYFTK